MRRIVSGAGLLAVALCAAWPSDADACGGFFCSNAPIDQSGEEIIFDIRDGKVEAHVEIQYVGTAEDFSWIVPVHGVPTLKIGSPTFFTYLATVTQPRFNVQWQQDDS